MNVFRDLSISANAQTMAAAVAEIEQALPAGWSRADAAEARTRAYPISTGRITYGFTCMKENRRPAAMLSLAQKDPSTFNVSNIIPIEQHQLEHAEYNEIQQAIPPCPPSPPWRISQSPPIFR